MSATALECSITRNLNRAGSGKGDWDGLSSKFGEKPECIHWKQKYGSVLMKTKRKAKKINK